MFAFEEKKKYMIENLVWFGAQLDCGYDSLYISIPVLYVPDIFCLNSAIFGDILDIHTV